MQALIRCVQGGKKCKINKHAYTSIWQSRLRSTYYININKRHLLCGACSRNLVSHTVIGPCNPWWVKISGHWSSLDHVGLLHTSTIDTQSKLRVHLLYWGFWSGSWSEKFWGENSQKSTCQRYILYQRLDRIYYLLAMIRLKIMPMRCPAPWMMKQWAIGAGNAPHGNLKGRKLILKF